MNKKVMYGGIGAAAVVVVAGGGYGYYVTHTPEALFVEQMKSIAAADYNVFDITASAKVDGDTDKISGTITADSKDIKKLEFKGDVTSGATSFKNMDVKLNGDKVYVLGNFLTSYLETSGEDISSYKSALSSMNLDTSWMDLSSDYSSSAPSYTKAQVKDLNEAMQKWVSKLDGKKFTKSGDDLTVKLNESDFKSLIKEVKATKFGKANRDSLNSALKDLSKGTGTVAITLGKNDTVKVKVTEGSDVSNLTVKQAKKNVTVKMPSSAMTLEEFTTKLTTAILSQYASSFAY
jgi:hypothetical protein